MTASKPLGTYGDAVGTVTPLDHKLAQSSLISKSAGIAVRPGLFWGGSATMVSGKANMSYDVAAFTAALSRGASAGTVLMANDGVVNVPTTAAPGSNSRWDVVYVWAREFSLDGTDSNPVIDVEHGTAASVPTVPSLSAYPGAIELARILVPAGVTATNSGTTITNTAPFTTVDGGTVVVRTTTERDAITTPSPDMRARCLADGIVYRYNGSAWKAWESDWVSYAATTSGFAVGSGGSAANVTKYKFVGGDVEVEYKFVFGTSGTTFPTNPTFTLPVTAVAPAHNYAPFLSRGSIYASAFDTAYISEVTYNGTSTTVARVWAASYGAISPTAPITWAAADVLQGRFFFTPA